MKTITQHNWHKIKLGNLAKITRGSSPRPIADQRYFDGGTIPWIKIADATKSGKYLYKTKEHVNEFGASFSRLLPKGSLIVAASGTLGYTQLLGVSGCVHDGWLIVEPSESLNIDFLYYLLKQQQKYFENHAYGAAIQNVNTGILKDLEVAIPDIDEQTEIGTILSTYDYLIENNARRIKILEQMAQSIYSEYFVKPLENAVLPKGWDISVLGDHLDELESGSRPKGGVGEIKEGVPSVGAENINGIGSHDYSSEKYVAESFFSQMNKGVVRDRDVAIYKDGAYIGRSSYFRDGFPHKQFSVNEHVFLLRSSGKRITQNFLYLWLREPLTIHEIRATNANAAQPGINQSGIRGLKITLPPKELLKEFDNKVEPMLAFIINLAKQNNELRMARDLLSPKLVTGKIKL